MGQRCAPGTRWSSRAKEIPEAPELRIGLDLYYGAFWDLHTCRQVGMGEGPISWLSIDAYAIARGFDDEQRDDLHHHIRAMDRAFLDFRARQSEKESKRRDRAPQPERVRKTHQTGRKGR